MTTLTNVPDDINLEIAQGATFNFNITYKDYNNNPIDVTGVTAALHMRKTAKSTSLLYEMTDANGKLIIGGANGIISGSISAADSTAFTWIDAVYDLELTFPNAEVKRILNGTVLIDKEVTK